MKHVICPVCGNSCSKYGRDKSGSQRWICRNCGGWKNTDSYPYYNLLSGIGLNTILQIYSFKSKMITEINYFSKMRTLSSGFYV